MTSFLIALQFLTFIPSPVRNDVSRDEFGHSIVWFPVVGIMLGAVLVAVDLLISPLLDRRVVDALLLTTIIALTGALHMDGLIDTVDGLSVGGDAAERLAVMRDSTARGPGVAAAALTLLAVYAALGTLDGAARTAGLLLAPLCGRSAILLGYATFRYPRPELGLSRALRDGATRGRVLVGLAMAAALCAFISGSSGILLLLFCLGFALCLGYGISRQLNGLSGDNHGLICETTQLLFLIAAPSFLTW